MPRGAVVPPDRAGRTVATSAPPVREGCEAFLRSVAERGGNVGSTIARLLQLLDAAGAAELEEALVEVLERDTVHVGAVR